VGVGRAILRGMKFAAYGFAGLLVYIVVYNIVAPGPEPRPSSSIPDSSAVADTGQPTAVPPPPPLPGQNKATAAAPRWGAKPPPAKAGEAPRIREVDVVELRGSVGAESGGGEGTTSAPTPATASVGLKSAADSPGIVIVVPPQRQAQPSRGMRWMKAVGRALHIGQKDEQ
jgi:hypothetical protein